ncbi:MAG: response regulator transcription factor [bacterium]
MEQIIFVYYFISYSLGIFCLGSFFLIQKYNKNEIVKLFMLWYIMFLFFMFNATLNFYIESILEVDQIIVNKIQIIQFASLVISMLILTYLINKLYLVPFSKFINKIFSGLAIIILSFIFIKEFIDQNLFEHSSYFDDELVLVVMFIYNITIFMRYKHKLENKKLFLIIKDNFFIILFFMPGFILDKFMALSGNYMIFTPLFFCIISLISLNAFIKYNYNAQSEKYTMPEVFVKKYNITNREKDVIILLLKGLSYKKISELLVISISTVRTHVMNIYKKVNINSRYELYDAVQELSKVKSIN